MKITIALPVAFVAASMALAAPTPKVDENTNGLQERQAVQAALAGLDLLTSLTNSDTAEKNSQKGSSGGSKGPVTIATGSATVGKRDGGKAGAALDILNGLTGITNFGTAQTNSDTADASSSGGSGGGKQPLNIVLGSASVNKRADDGSGKLSGLTDIIGAFTGLTNFGTAEQNSENAENSGGSGGSSTSSPTNIVTGGASARRAVEEHCSAGQSSECANAIKRAFDVEEDAKDVLLNRRLLGGIDTSSGADESTHVYSNPQVNTGAGGNQAITGDSSAKINNFSPHAKRLLGSISTGSGPDESTHVYSNPQVNTGSGGNQAITGDGSGQINNLRKRLLGGIDTSSGADESTHVYSNPQVNTGTGGNQAITGDGSGQINNLGKRLLGSIDTGSGPDESTHVYSNPQVNTGSGGNQAITGDGSGQINNYRRELEDAFEAADLARRYALGFDVSLGKQAHPTSVQGGVKFNCNGKGAAACVKDLTKIKRSFDQADLARIALLGGDVYGAAGHSDASTHINSNPQVSVVNKRLDFGAIFDNDASTHVNSNPQIAVSNGSGNSVNCAITGDGSTATLDCRRALRRALDDETMAKEEWKRMVGVASD
ncbi:hypothetical protein IE53DRAFT_386834 [Violaceomyces palustris]|uniref:Uncharacterized protein n=1 Tax=Violaceomyces palustris TaxID=1673888 RepID=A0ACD0NYC4_9BASI|nr:hypothetical protein IE53DRAFT_386834 [Violaceomyces palustris]